MKPTIASIFRQSFDSYIQALGPQPPWHLKIADAIMACRTALLGGQRERCDACGYEVMRYHSCRNRHCPQCQTSARLNWVSDRLKELLPVGYFHAVFTIPSQLNPFVLRNKKVFYDLMFRAVKETILELGANRKYLGADMGCIAVLHTWGQTLVDHPHIHCIVPGGGFDPSAMRWKPATAGFLFPIPVVQALYRGKMMAFFRQALGEGTIVLHGILECYRDSTILHGLIDSLYRKDWVVYIKEPFASPEALVRYLGAYTHRVAISDSRVMSVSEGHVSFTYKDYTDNNRQKVMRLTAVEFLRRFMLHVIPRGFKRIRYFGFLAPRARAKRLNRCRTFFRKPLHTAKKRARPWYETVKELTGKDPLRCTECGQGILRRIAVLPRWYESLAVLPSG
jgi:hypothetical protein